MYNYLPIGISLVVLTFRFLWFVFSGAFACGLDSAVTIICYSKLDFGVFERRTFVLQRYYLTILNFSFRCEYLGVMVEAAAAAVGERFEEE